MHVNLKIYFPFSKIFFKGDPEYADSLNVLPLSGVVKANGEMNLELTFAPKVERIYNYNLICNLKRKSRPVSLNVKGVGYILNHNVYL